MPISGRISFDHVEGGTQVTLEEDIEAADFLRLVEPIKSRMARRKKATDAQTSKDLLGPQA